MDLQHIRTRMNERGIFHSQDSICGRPTVIGYDKRFRWRWFATQLNTFVVACDHAAEPATVALVEQALNQSFQYARAHYRGWPRGLQSGVGVIVMMLATNADEEALRYCRESRAGKKWAGFSVPVIVNPATGQVHSFERYPMWGRIYYPFFREVIDGLTS